MEQYNITRFLLLEDDTLDLLPSFSSLHDVGVDVYIRQVFIEKCSRGVHHSVGH